MVAVGIVHKAAFTPSASPSEGTLHSLGNLARRVSSLATILSQVSCSRTHAPVELGAQSQMAGMMISPRDLLLDVGTLN